IVKWSLGLAASLALLALAIVRMHGHKIGDTIGNATWDFSNSWASNVTAFSAVFVFLTQLTTFPAKPFMATRTEYAFLAALSVALAAAAPVVQRVAGSNGVVTSAAGEPAASTCGLVGGFLLACAFTLWGAFLQMGVEFLVLAELMRSVTVGPTAIDVTYAL